TTSRFECWKRFESGAKEEKTCYPTFPKVFIEVLPFQRFLELFRFKVNFVSARKGIDVESLSTIVFLRSLRGHSFGNMACEQTCSQ
ncbi:MAG: hypothetical protein KDD64_14670, partial [Bdellovibrionales bacterium]|nr:hypothetical protein [Bdellovibrionales bacterium]